MKCNNCDREVNDDSRFCPYCGKEIIHTKTCSKCGYEAQKDFVFCPMCGSKLDSPRVCPNCGQQVADECLFCNLCGTRIDAQAHDFAYAKPKRANKQSIKNAKSKGTVVVQKIVAKKDFVQRIVFAVVAAVILICSFFSVISADFSDVMEDNLGFDFEEEIKFNVTAIDLIDFAFFSIGLDEREASDYLNDRDLQNKEKEYQKFWSSINYDDGKIEEDDCRELAKIINDIPYLKIVYAQSVSADKEAGQSTFGLFKIAGFVCLALILLSFVVLVLSIVGLVRQANFASLKLVSIIFGIVIFLLAMLLGYSTIEDYEIGAGAGFVAILVFACIYMLYCMAGYLLDEKKINWKSFMEKATAVVMGIIILCLFASSAVSVTIPYTYTSGAESIDVDFRYEFNQTELFDQYFIKLEEDDLPTVNTINGNFEYSADRFAESNDLLEGDEYFKGSIGMVMLLQNQSMYKFNQWLIQLSQGQAVLYLFALMSAVSLLVNGLGGLCGAKVSKKLMYVALAIIIIFAIYCIVVPIAMDITCEVIKLVDMDIVCGGGVIGQLIIAVASIILLLCSRLLRGKVLKFGFGVNNKGNKYSYAKTASFGTKKSSAKVIVHKETLSGDNKSEYPLEETIVVGNSSNDIQEDIQTDIWEDINAENRQL